MKQVLIVFVLFFLVSNVFSQQMNLKYANKLYKQMAFAEAIEYFQKVLADEPNNSDAIHKIADCFRQTGNVPSAERYYGKAVVLPDTEPIEKFYYGQLLMQTGEYNDAKKWLEEYKKQAPGDERTDQLLAGIDNRPKFLQDSASFKIKNLTAVNSENSEFGPAYFNDGIIFSSNRYSLDAFDNKHSWTGKDYYSLSFYKSSDTSKDKALNLANNVQTKYNDGPVSFDSKNKILYITRNQAEKKKVVKAGDDQVKLRIFSFVYDDQKKKWSAETAFQNNDNSCNVAHPAISEDGNTLIFSSDLPGSYGGMDLYICHKIGMEWSKPVNLGSLVNTKGNEVFPFIQNDMVFFASNGHEGLGGLDIFYSKINNDKADKPVHISYPINSQKDDFGLIVSKDGKTGYFASNRVGGGKGDDDIYAVEINKSFTPDYIVKGIAKNKNTGNPLGNTLVQLVDNNGIKIGEVQTTEDGKYKFKVVLDKQYNLKGTKEKFSEGVNEFSTKNQGDKTEFVSDVELAEIPPIELYGKITDKETKAPINNVKIKIVKKETGEEVVNLISPATGDFLKPLDSAKVNDVLSYEIFLECDGYMKKQFDFKKQILQPGRIDVFKELEIVLEKIELGKDLAKMIDIKPIYFDLSKWNIRQDAAVELDKIVKVMTEYPTMQIELGSHTDCRSSAASNMILSDQRAKSSADYIISKGIESKRITGKGYGETKLINGCACEGAVKSKCSEEEHQQNRRTEFLIVKI